MKKIIIGISIFCGLLVISGYLTYDKLPQLTRSNMDGVILNDYDTKDISLKVESITFNEKQFSLFREQHSKANLTRDYVIGILLDKLYPISDKEIDQLLSKEKEFHEEWEDYWSTNNVTEKSYLEKLKYTEQLKRLVTDTLEIDDEVLLDYYQANVTTSTENIQHILVNERETADIIYKKLEKGEVFSDLANQYSLDYGTNSQGGLWSDYQPGTTLEVIDEQIGNLMEVGQYSEPFKSVLGWHIVKLQGLKEEVTFKDIKEQMKEEYIDSKMTLNYVRVLLDQLIEENLDLFNKDIQKELTREEELVNE